MKFLIVAVLVALAFPASAAARPTLDLDKAERTANEYVLGMSAEYNEDADDANEGGEIGVIKITSTEFFGCDAETRYRALCDAEYTYADGYVEEDVISVVVSRRGRYLVQ